MPRIKVGDAFDNFRQAEDAIQSPFAPITMSRRDRTPLPSETPHEIKSRIEHLNITYECPYYGEPRESRKKDNSKQKFIKKSNKVGCKARVYLKYDSGKLIIGSLNLMHTGHMLSNEGDHHFLQPVIPPLAIINNNEKKADDDYQFVAQTEAQTPSSKPKQIKQQDKTYNDCQIVPLTGEIQLQDIARSIEAVHSNSQNLSETIANDCAQDLILLIEYLSEKKYKITIAQLVNIYKGLIPDKIKQKGHTHCLFGKGRSLEKEKIKNIIENLIEMSFFQLRSATLISDLNYEKEYFYIICTEAGLNFKNFNNIGNF